MGGVHGSPSFCPTCPGGCGGRGSIEKCLERWAQSLASFWLYRGAAFSSFPTSIPFSSVYLWVFPGGASGKGSTCQCRRHERHGFDLWVGKILWSRKWQLTPVFLPGKSQGQRSLAGYSPWGCKSRTRLSHQTTTKVSVL